MILIFKINLLNDFILINEIISFRRQWNNESNQNSNPFKNLRWLDMAFNKITKINGELLQLEALQILDLRANQISNIWEVEKNIIYFNFVLKISSTERDTRKNHTK